MEVFNLFSKRGDNSLPWPEGNNDTDTVFGGVHFNLTILKHFNYTYYANGTVSNNSQCSLTFKPHEPALLLTNGTWVNDTNCYTALDPIGTRGYVGIGFAVAYGLGLVLTITALAKHGALYLPTDKRFYPIGRRWQWYWGLFVCACAFISLITNVDVDRYYLQQLPIILTTFFWFLMCMGTTALVWEAVRHWGSWLERQFIDPNPFIYAQDDKRAMFEFYLPLFFYFWDWLNFFLVVPRSWNFAEMQHSIDQTAQIAAPGATSGRFKAGAFVLLVCYGTILVSLRHSVNHYMERNRGAFNRARGLVAAVPLRFYLLLPLLLAMIAYQVTISFIWDFSVIKYDGNPAIIYGWGYGPPLAIVYVQILYGLISPNEDKELYRQRRARGEMNDRELGLVKKPAWWRLVRGDHVKHSTHARIGMNVKEIGGGHATGRRVEDTVERQIREDALREARNDEDIELEYMRRGSRYNNAGATDPRNPRVDRAGARALSLQHNSAVAEGDEREEEGLDTPTKDLGLSSPPPPYSDRGRIQSGQRSDSTSTNGSLQGRPQQIRSMLEI